jgi:sulfotransferase family protein
MTSVTLRLAMGREVTFELNEAGVGPAYFVLGIRKCGTTLLNRVCRMLAERNGYAWVNMGGTLFNANVQARNWQDDPTLAHLLRPGNVYGGLRDAPRMFQDHEIFRSGLKLVIVRDPRDALVSEFFSNAYSHPIPEQTPTAGEVAQLMLSLRQKAMAEGIDGYVIERASSIVRTFMEFAAVIQMPNTRVLRYEEVVLDKRQLIGTITEHFGWGVPERAVGKILASVDIRPEKEDPRAFIRQVTPGDHKRKLARTTIVRLNQLLWPAMNLLGYPAD